MELGQCWVLGGSCPHTAPTAAATRTAQGGPVWVPFIFPPLPKFSSWGSLEVRRGADGVHVGNVGCCGSAWQLVSHQPNPCRTGGCPATPSGTGSPQPHHSQLSAFSFQTSSHPSQFTSHLSQTPSHLSQSISHLPQSISHPSRFTSHTSLCLPFPSRFWTAMRLNTFGMVLSHFAMGSSHFGLGWSHFQWHGVVLR